MKALDLFCGAGGASGGLHEIGFDVLGIDIEPQPEYPFLSYTMDVFDVEMDLLKSFDLIWASPPCQNYSIGTKGFRNKGKKYPDLVDRTRKILSKANIPFVIENVPGAPIRKDLMLCGCMFGLKVFKRRYFEIHGFRVEQPIHEKHNGGVCTGEYICTSTACVNPGCFGKRKEYKKKYGMIWKENNKIENWQKALDIDWITDRKMLAEAIPPAYSKFIGEQFKKYRSSFKFL